MPPEPHGPLAGVRVLDLATPRAEIAGRMLADLGAEVLKVEPPGGAASRRLPPFVDNPERGQGGAMGGRSSSNQSDRSLYWAALGLNKRSVVIDLDAEAGRERLRQLARHADVLIESYDPGTLDAAGLGYQALSALNPGLVYVSVTPFGQKGPKALWPATELTLEAAGGRISIQGDRDRPPLPIGYPQAAFHAGARAAADAIIALNERAFSGRGQHLDTSMQEAVIWMLMNWAGFPPNTGRDPPGAADDRADPLAPRPTATALGIFVCADGYVLLTPTSDKNVFASLPEVGAFASDPPKARAVLAEWLKTKTKLELAEWAWSADIHLGTVNTTRDIVAHPQLAGRGYWTKVGEHVVPGPPVRLSRTPIVLARPAPTLGADEAIAEAWLQDDASRPSTSSGRTEGNPVRGEPARPEPGRREPREATQTPRLGEAFAGLRVVDFSWVAVGPLTGKALADHGATVVRVESSTRVDYLRTLTPFKDDVAGINRSHYYNNVNTSKLGIALDFATEGGLALARRLAAWADVVIENFTPGTMKRLGLDYETLSRGRPELIMLSTCLMGQTGPWASFAGYGPHGAAIAGLHAITGWPDRAPCGPNGPYTDVIVPHYSVAALSAAILERRKSGLGQNIDMSQIEAALHFIEPLLLDETVNGRTATAQGLDSPTSCPYGVYATQGAERYIAIAVETPAQWRALRSLAPLGAFADARYDALDARRAARDAIDAALSAWVAEHEPFELEKRLIEAGVPASVVQRMTDLHADPQLAARGFFVPLRHSEVGEMPYDGLITRFSAKRRMLHKASPCLGEDTEHVLRNLLGLTPDEIAEYAAQDVFV